MLNTRRLPTTLGAVHHETEVFRFNVLSAGLEAVVQAVAGRSDGNGYKPLYSTGLHGVFSVDWLIHVILLR